MSNANATLATAADESVDIIDKLCRLAGARRKADQDEEGTVTESRANATCPPVNPAFLNDAKAVILLRSTKAGLGIGYHTGHGILLARLPGRSSTTGVGRTSSGSTGTSRSSVGANAPRWSAPVFLKVTVGQFGIIMGYETIDTFILAMTRKLIEQLLEGSHTVMGVDQSLVVLSPEVEDKSDVIATSSTDTDLVAVSHNSGLMLDFSLSGGAMSVNQSKMKEAYGPNIGMSEVIQGLVAAPAELAPLYAKLSEMVGEAGEVQRPSLTRTSLERFTSGYHVDQRNATAAMMADMGYAEPGSAPPSGMGPSSSSPRSSGPVAVQGSRVTVDTAGGTPAVGGQGRTLVGSAPASYMPPSGTSATPQPMTAQTGKMTAPSAAGTVPTAKQVSGSVQETARVAQREA